MDITELRFERETRFNLYSKYLKGCAVQGSNPCRSKRSFSPSKMFRPALGPSQPSIKRVEEYFQGG
jgi:hypothetical protein